MGTESREIQSDATSVFGAIAFLSSHPARESHDLALVADPTFQHTAFEVRSLPDLRALHQRVLGRGVPVKMALNHGASLANAMNAIGRAVTPIRESAAEARATLRDHHGRAYGAPPAAPP
jgi:hypothetical protein